MDEASDWGLKRDKVIEQNARAFGYSLEKAKALTSQDATDLAVGASDQQDHRSTRPQINKTTDQQDHAAVAGDACLQTRGPDEAPTVP